MVMMVRRVYTWICDAHRSWCGSTPGHGVAPVVSGTAVNPNLFLVGVQRSATTGLWTFLGQHPDIFMGQKELHHFGSDLGRFGTTVDQGARPDRAQYLSYYQGAGEAAYAGDVSVGYIYSQVAAREIHEFSPEARIVVSFRNPVDMAYSLHSLMRFQGAEPEPSFEVAVADDSRPRWAFTSWPFRWAFTYPRLLRFSEQLERYYEVFGRQRVHVVIYEDFVADRAEVYRGILDFLGVDTAFVPDFPVVFANREERSRLVGRWMERTPLAVRGLGRLLVPSQGARRRLGRRIEAANQKVVARPELDPSVRARLSQVFEPEVTRLSTLLDRDLRSQWALDPQPAS